MKKTWTGREFAQLLSENGYYYLRTKGDHKIYSNGNRIISFNHINLNRMVARRLIKENELVVK